MDARGAIGAAVPLLRKWHGYARAPNDGSDHPVDLIHDICTANTCRNGETTTHGFSNTEKIGNTALKAFVLKGKGSSCTPKSSINLIEDYKSTCIVCIIDEVSKPSFGRLLDSSSSLNWLHKNRSI